MAVRIIEADLNNPKHAEYILFLTNSYALDEMGGGKPLSEFVRENLMEGLRNTPGSLIFLALDGERPIGIATCFIGFSTFNAKPLINIHDLGVIPEYRGKGIGQKLLKAVEEKAREEGCCKLTLEVLEHNPAKRLYEREGFKASYVFMNKNL